eukprot:gene10147-12450_t
MRSHDLNLYGIDLLRETLSVPQLRSIIIELERIVNTDKIDSLYDFYPKWDDYEIQKERFRQSKNQLQAQCPNLTHVYINDFYYNYFYRLKFKDHKQLSFSVKRCTVVLDFESPSSNQSEHRFAIYADDPSILKDHPFSFQFLLDYQPRKLYLGTHSANIVVEFKLNCLHRVLNCQSIQTVKFKYHTTPFCFLLKSLKDQSGIQSLRVEMPDGDKIQCRFKQYWVVDEIVDDDLVTHEYSTGKQMVLDLLSKNTTLRRLVIKDLKVVDYKTFFQHLIVNKQSSLKSLGFSTTHFIQDKVTPSDLSPLLELPKIDTLYCHLNALKSYLDHIKINHNIRILKCVFFETGREYYTSDNKVFYELELLKTRDIVEQFIEFYKQQDNISEILISTSAIISK